MDSKFLKTLERQNDLIIRLLARMAFTQRDLKELITRNKRNPSKYVEGYNAMDGTKSVSEIAKLVGVTATTISPILASWEEEGVVYQVEGEGGKFYKRLFPIK